MQFGGFSFITIFFHSTWGEIFLEKKPDLQSSNQHISNCMDSKMLNTPKLNILQMMKTKRSISLDSRFVNLENTGLLATLPDWQTVCKIEQKETLLSCGKSGNL